MPARLPVSAGPVEASALGNLCAQWIALGAIEDLDAARGLIQASFPVEEYKPKDAVPAAAREVFMRLVYGGDKEE